MNLKKLKIIHVTAILITAIFTTPLQATDPIDLETIDIKTIEEKMSHIDLGQPDIDPDQPNNQQQNCQQETTIPNFDDFISETNAEIKLGVSTISKLAKQIINQEINDKEILSSLLNQCKSHLSKIKDLETDLELIYFKTKTTSEANSFLVASRARMNLLDEIIKKVESDISRVENTRNSQRTNGASSPAD